MAMAACRASSSRSRCRSKLSVVPVVICLAAVSLALCEVFSGAATLAWLTPAGRRAVSGGRSVANVERARLQVRQLFGGKQEDDSGEGKVDEARSEAEKEKIEKLQAQIEELTQQAEEKKNSHERLTMEVSNFRARTAKELVAARSKAAIPVIKELMGIADDFELARANLKVEGDGEKAIVDRFSGLFDKMLDNWKELGFEKMSSVGLDFDPELHEAVTMLPSTDYKDGVVSNAYREGWKLKSVGSEKPSVLRPALVVVSSGPGP